MAVKTVSVETKLGEKFRMESNLHGHRVVVDQPANAGGTDAGPTPLDYLLISLAGCIGTIGRIVAMQKKLAVRGMSITVEGDINTDGLLGKPTNDPVGFKEIRVQVTVDGDMSAAQKEAFVHEVDARCPVSQNLMGRTPLKVSLA